MSCGSLVIMTGFEGGRRACRRDVVGEIAEEGDISRWTALGARWARVSVDGLMDDVLQS